jgi:hypothetical protein
MEASFHEPSGAGGCLRFDATVAKPARNAAPRIQELLFIYPG